MAAHRLGQFYEGFASYRRMLGRATVEAQPVIFSNCVAEAAGYVRAGLDRTVAADELVDIAENLGWDDHDKVQAIIAQTFAAIENDRPQRFNGSPIDYEDWADPVRLDREQEPRVPAATIPLALPFPIDASAIPHRPWIVPGLLLRRHVTLLIAPPGSGKSLLTLQLAIMCAAPLAHWAGWRPCQRARVLIINSEEDSDELERRLWAAAEVMQVPGEQLRDVLSYAVEPDDIVIAKADSRTKTVLRTPMVDAIIATVRSKHIDILVVDPFAETFIGDENSNSELKWAAVLWREVARATDCAVLLVHHAKKGSATPGDMDAARGGGSLAGVARIVCTLFAMTEQEAGELLDDPEERGRYLRFDDAKANLTLITPLARWFEKQTKTLNNGTDDEPADQVGVLVPWQPVSAFENMTNEQAQRILDEIEAGVIGEDGLPTGDWFLNWKRGQKPKYWVGDVVQRVIGCTEKETKNIIKKWLKARVLETFTAQTPQTKRHMIDSNVRVLCKPGVISHENHSMN